MITVIVKLKPPETITRNQARETFLSTAPKYKGMGGLVRKYYFVSEHGKAAGGAYL